jgi:hypothetical protein
MAFCTNCGAQIEGQFCTKCGARAEGPGAGSQPGQPPTPQPAPPPPPASQPAGFAPAPAPVAGPRKVSPWIWVLGGCLTLVVLVVVGILGAGFFFAHKVKQAGDNPALAAIRLMTMANPDVEEVSSDPDKGTITLREKKTGKVMTFNFEDIKNGRLTFESDGKKVEVTGSGEGESGSIEVKTPEGTSRLGAGSAADIPAWIPKYPGSKPEGAFSTQGEDGPSGAYGFRTSDPVEKIAGYYEQSLKAAGMSVERAATGGNSVHITGRDEGKNRQTTVGISARDGEAHVAVTYSGK